MEGLVWPSRPLVEMLGSGWVLGAVLGSVMPALRVLVLVGGVLVLAVLATETRCFGQDLQCIPGTGTPETGCTISGTPAPSGRCMSIVDGKKVEGPCPGSSAPVCTVEHPCISDTDGPTEAGLAYLCGGSRVAHYFQALQHHWKRPKPGPPACADLDDKYGPLLNLK